MRIDHDSIGEVSVEDDCYWGAQTQRSFKNFPVGTKIPIDLIKSYALLKKCAAKSNNDIGVINSDYEKLITNACDEIIDGKLSDYFPLKIFQTGSGTQTNMNLNEVISNRANEIFGNSIGTYSPIHPNDHVNASQSSNDTFPTAMHICLCDQIYKKLIPSLKKIISSFEKKELEFNHIIKIGRTHLQDATPITMGQVFSSYKAQLKHVLNNIEDSMPRLESLAIGGTAVGTGINCPKGFADNFINHLNSFLPYNFTQNENKFEGIATHDAIVQFSGSLNLLAVSLNKIIHDLRMLASGPRCGLGELIFPQNEPGSSIMPGKVNPTQAEAMSMICMHVIGNNLTTTLGGLSGHFELNTYKPLIFYNTYESVNILSDGMNQFTNMCLNDISANEARINELMSNSLMLVTALAPTLGYEISASIAKKAHAQNKTLKEIAVNDGHITSDKFDELVKPEKMI
jgi:fumarate hydratase class II